MFLLSRKSIGWMTPAIALSLLLNSCSGQPEATAPRAIPVKLQTLEGDNLIDSSEYVGQLQARQRVNVSPRVSGRIRTIFVDSGATVTAGQKIAELDPEQQQQQVNAGIGQVNSARANLETSEAEYRQTLAQDEANQARISQSQANVANSRAVVKSRIADLSAREADLQRATANLTLARKNLERARFLVKEGAQAQQDLDNSVRAETAARADVDAARKTRDAARAAVDAANADLNANQQALNIAIKNRAASNQQVAAARSNVNARRAAVASAEGQLGATRQDLIFNSIFAPIDGVVGDFNQLKAGDFIAAGNQLTSLVNNKVLDLNVQIPVELLPRLRTGLPVEIIGKDGKPGVRGQITFISPTVSQASQSVLVKFSFANDGSLKDQQYVRTRVIWDEKPGILIPTTAITSVGAQKFVFVAQNKTEEGGKESLVVRQRPIQVGNIQGQAYQVLSGVNRGDRVAVNRILDLRDGTAITASTN